MKRSLYTRVGAELRKQTRPAIEPIDEALKQLFDLLADELKGERISAPFRKGRESMSNIVESDFFLRRQAQVKAFVSLALGGPSAYTPRDLGRVFRRGAVAESDFKIAKDFIPLLLARRGLSLSGVEEVRLALRDLFFILEDESELA